MSSTASTINDFLVPGELVPGAVNATMDRLGDVASQASKVAGATVNDEGIVNNYAVYPQKYAVAESSDDEKFRQGVLFALATWVPIGIAFFVS